MASSSEASKAEVNDDTAVTTTSRNNNNNPFAREQEKREGHFDAEGKNELTSQTPSSSSPKISDGRTNEKKKIKRKKNKRIKETFRTSPEYGFGGRVPCTTSVP
jgi:hypothetical protein